ncbi:hypothetical protein BGZ60DRAFT_421341 [Tricladium varicosporioides]|nr:hypothetical protein BGZ60DRAFT_421341 [Hymenoscyphus varicosporioides]
MIYRFWFLPFLFVFLRYRHFCCALILSPKLVCGATTFPNGDYELHTNWTLILHFNMNPSRLKCSREHTVSHGV